MKSLLKTTLSILIIQCSLFNAPANGQNLVSNASFEDYTSCPDNECQIHRAIGWSSWGFTPDYYNVCATNSNVSVPQNAFGNQSASDGSAYVGMYCYGNNSREFIATELSSPLEINQKYNISLKVSLADITNCATDKIGVFFSSVPFSLDTSCQIITVLPPPNYSQFYSNVIITSDSDWTEITGSFISDSAYQYMGIGNFFDDSTSNHIKLDSSNWCFGYYYFDDVTVLLDTTDTITNTNVISENRVSDILIYPSPSISFIIIETVNLTDHPITLRLYDVIGKVVLEDVSLLNCISAISHSPVILAITSLSNNFSPKYLLLSL